MLARRPLARQTSTSSFHCWGVFLFCFFFFYSKDGHVKADQSETSVCFNFDGYWISNYFMIDLLRQS